MLFTAGCQDAAEMGAVACEGLDGKDRDHCIQQLAVASMNIHMCNDIESVGPKSKCWLYIAASSKQLSVCGSMSDQDWYGKQGSYDKYQCVQYFARELNAPDVCLELESYRDSDGSDLNPDGISKDICFNSIQCGKTGQASCYDTKEQQYYCTAGDETQWTNAPMTCP